MSLWERLRAALRPARRGAAPAGLPAAASRRTAPAPAHDDVEKIMTYARRIGPIDERPERCDAEILAALSRLLQSGPVAQAVALGGMVASALPHDAQLQLAVAELLCGQRDYRQATPLLQRALRAPRADRDQQLRAHFLLHEAAVFKGEVATAVTHLTQLLAEDFGYPGARTRLAALTTGLPGGELGAAGALLEGPRGAPPIAPQGGLQAPATPTLLGLRSGPGARYQLVRELGCGSTGAVYLVLDTQLQSELALKVFYPRRRAGPDAADDEAVLRALHEARLLSAVRHPGVIALYELAGEPPDEPPPRLAMELCRGGSLRARLQMGPLPARAALLRAAELLSTLVAVHFTGVIHGDIKPENLLFRGPELHRRDLPPAEALLGDLVLSDFGLARLGAQAQAASRGLGTFGYSAPEQLAGAPAEPASDLYAAAVVLLEMLCGELPQTSAEALLASSPRSRIPAAPWAAVAAALGPQEAALRGLLEELLGRQPGLRPTAEDALARLLAIMAALPGGRGDSDPA